MSYTLTTALNIYGDELKDRINPNGNVFFYFSLEALLQQLKYSDDAKLYNGKICAIPLKREPIPSDKKESAKKFLEFFNSPRLFQTERGIIIPEHIAKKYENIDFRELHEYVPWPIMYCSQTNQ